MSFGYNPHSYFPFCVRGTYLAENSFQSSFLALANCEFMYCIDLNVETIGLFFLPFKWGNFAKVFLGT